MSFGKDNNGFYDGLHINLYSSRCRKPLFLDLTSSNNTRNNPFSCIICAFSIYCDSISEVSPVTCSKCGDLFECIHEKNKHECIPKTVKYKIEKKPFGMS